MIMGRWQDCHGDEDETLEDRYEKEAEREERRAEDAREEEFQESLRAAK